MEIDDMEIEESDTERTVKKSFAEVLGMTEGSKLKKETQAYVDRIDPEQALERIADLKKELYEDRAQVASYLAEVITLKDRIKMGASMEETQTFLERMRNTAKSVIGLRKGLANATDGEIINLLVGDFSKRSHYLTERIDHVMEKRDEATTHMGQLKVNRREAIPMMQEAEAAIREMHKEKQRLEARLQQKLAPEVRDAVEDEYDLLKDTWFIEGEKLAEATYTIELCSNVLGTMRIYKANIDNLLREARGLKRTVDITVDTIKPAMKSVVTVADLANTVTETVDSHEVLREYINSVLPKITEMTAYFPELIQDSFDGKFFKDGINEYLKKCDNKYNLMKDLAQVEMYVNARKTLEEAGIEVPDFDAGELVFHKPDSEEAGIDSDDGDSAVGDGLGEI